MNKTNKAIILSHDRGGVYVMDKDGSFRFVRGYSSRPVGAEIEIREVSFVSFGRTTAVAAGFALITFFSCFAWLWSSVNLYVFVDVNPGVELQFNRLNRLRFAFPLNEDGATLLDTTHFSGRVEDVTVLLLETAEQRGFLDAESGVNIEIFTTGGKSPDAVVYSIKTALAESGIPVNPVVSAGDESDWDSGFQRWAERQIRNRRL